MADLLARLGERIRDAEVEAARVLDPVIGLVVDNRDPERLGRVRVSFPTLPGDDASAWAPLAGVGAGPGRGWWFLPEIDDEVLVAFERGDVGRPVVLGALWNGVDRPPPGGDHRRVVRSRSGCQIALDEATGAVTIEDGEGSARVVLDGAGDVVIEAADGGDVELVASGALRVEAGRLEIEASESLVLRAGGSAALSAATIELRGGTAAVSAARIDLGR